MASERTFIAVKPDGVQRNLVGEIIQRFEKKGYKLVGLKMLQPSAEQAQQHYIDLASKPFYKDLVAYFSSGPIVGMVWEGKGVVKGGRTLLGATNPADSLPGTIRGDFAVDVGRNVCHGSDSVENAKREITFWFKTEEVINWTSHSVKQIYESA
ncbi:nucleoside diphosphate kinase [Trypanosoma grayi]|uniref:nucleoside diphosphate kinase n=1 Tax=Trypanosoma grayi TaxID=71804 RepID=UPI0004F42829|nr:nucleoside diphosphate kinase [Trypanosoma grayi]KEG08759.1 nucleoside diphosphate kinase [Trypanosoma grayi]